MNDRREQVEQAANRIRQDLLVTLSELDRRRDRALDPRHQLQQHLGLVAGVGGGLAALTAALTAWSIHRRRTAAARRRKEWRRAFRRAWEHPERLATRAQERPAPAELGRKLLLVFGLAFGTQLAKRSALKLLRSPRPQPAA